ncbi:MAG: OmpA family protein [Bacteroidales bacterium]
MNNKLVQLSILIILFNCTWMFSQNQVQIQNANNCSDAIEVSTLSVFGPTTPPSEIKTKQATNNFEPTQHSVWYKFKSEKDGILLFDIIPMEPQDNYDFMLYKINSSNYCNLIEKGKLEPIASNFDRNNPALNGMTGLSFNENTESYSKGIEVKKGEQFLLVLNNMYEGKGHTLVFKYFENFMVKGKIELPGFTGEKNAKVFWTNLRTRETNSSIVNDKNGEFSLKINVNTEAHKFPEYLLWVGAEGYDIADTVIASRDIPGIEHSFFNFKLNRLKTGNCDFLPKVLFEPNNLVIKPESLMSLDRILRILKMNNSLEIILEGHSNGFYPSTEVDQNLSVGRAEIVKKWLIDNGIEASRLSCRGFGSEKMLFPMAQDEFEENMNRRVEVFIIKF